MDSSSYETHLTTLSLEELRAEPGALQTQAHHLTSSLTSLTHTSYPTFLSLHQSTTALSTSLNSLSDSLKDLVSTSLPALQNETAAWSENTTDILRERSKARLVLDQHDKIKDLLDIPIFIDSCVRNGYFQEALALYKHISSLAARPGAPPILASVHAEVEAAMAQMLVVLLGTLYESGRKLPSLWKAVNFLRKMDAFGSSKDHSDSRVVEHGHVTLDDQDVSTDDLLALAFLAGRLACLTTALEPISRDIHRLTDSPVISVPSDTDNFKRDTTTCLSDRDQEDIARYLKKYIDVWREGAYDTLSQYSTIFLEQQPTQHPSLSPLNNPTIQAQHQQASTHIPFLSLLSPRLLSLLFPVLKSTLPLLSLSLLPSLLTQLTYCAMAFARVGLDFRGLLSGLINSAVSNAVRLGLDAVPPLMGKDRNRNSLIKKPSEWLVTGSFNAMDALSSLQARASAAQGPPHIPPQILTTYPPLARLTNALLGVLNSLRLLAPVRIMHDLLDMLDKTLGMTGEELVRYLSAHVKGNEQSKNRVQEEKEEKVSKAVGGAYFNVLVPFMRRALIEGVYGVEISKVGEEGESDMEETLKKAVQEWNDVCNA